MARLAGISGARAVAALGRSGYRVVRQRGSHVVLKARGKPALVIPLHRSLAPFLLRSQILRAGLSEEEFLELLK